MQIVTAALLDFGGDFLGFYWKSKQVSKVPLGRVVHFLNL